MSKPETKLLHSGREFFDDLLHEISCAQHFVVVSAFLWRNDSTGQRVAQGLLEAANRGVKVVIIKDRLGALFEYSERTGQSMFHSNLEAETIWGDHSLKTLYLQARWMARLYQNSELKPLSESCCAHVLKDHKNILVIDQYKQYDHSKTICIDEHINYVGGVGFGDEFNDVDDLTWLDFMCKFKGNEAIISIKDIHTCHKEGHTLYDDLEIYMEQTQTELVIVMSFMGKVRFIKQIVDLLSKNIKVTVLTSAEAHSNHYRNHHFIKRLWREAGMYRKNLTIVLTDKIIHAKVFLRDNFCVRVGSQNIVLMQDVVNDTIAQFGDRTISRQLIQWVNAQREQGTTKVYSRSQGYDMYRSHYPWKSIIIGSRLEWLAALLQTYMILFRKKSIKKIRKQVQKQKEDFIRS